MHEHGAEPAMPSLRNDLPFVGSGAVPAAENRDGTCSDPTRLSMRVLAQAASPVTFAERDPLEEAVIDEGAVASIRSVTTMPRAGAIVYEAGADLTVSALGLEPTLQTG